MSSQQMSLKDTHQPLAKELQLHKTKLMHLQTDLEKLNAKMHTDENMSIDDIKFISELGWFAALSVLIVAAASAAL